MLRDDRTTCGSLEKLFLTPSAEQTEYNIVSSRESGAHKSEGKNGPMKAYIYWSTSNQDFFK